MAFTIPEIEPQEIQAGDRIQWKRTNLDDFPADSWTLTYYLRSDQPGSAIDIVATADSLNFEVDVAPSESAAYTPATYYWTAFVSKSGDRKLVASGRLVIKEDPSQIALPVDGRSHARRTLEALEAVIERRATSDQQRYAFSAVGRSVDKMPIADVLKFRDYYLSIVKQEDAREKVARGESTGKNVFIKFS